MLGLPLDAPTFVRLYADEVLGRLDPEQVHRELMQLAGGRIPVICCFERADRLCPGQYCHRALAAAWLSESLGVMVPEFGFETLSQEQHPLRPPYHTETTR
jgi:hypothetical protein